MRFDVSLRIVAFVSRQSAIVEVIWDRSHPLQCVKVSVLSRRTECVIQCRVGPK
jgi:hypothetical protein